MTGLKSPYGRRGSICAHFSWTWDYLHHGLPWATIQRMLIDAPSIETEKDGKKHVEITPDNVDDIINSINAQNA